MCRLHCLLLAGHGLHGIVCLNFRGLLSKFCDGAHDLGLHLIFSALSCDFELLRRVLYPEGPVVLPVVTYHVAASGSGEVVKNLHMMQCHGLPASLVVLLVFSLVIVFSWFHMVYAAFMVYGFLVVLTVSTAFMGLSGSVVSPFGLFGVSWLGVSSLEMMSVSSSLSALMVSSCVFHCRHLMIHGLGGVHLQFSTLQAFQALQGLAYGVDRMFAGRSFLLASQSTLPSSWVHSPQCHW